MSVRVNTSRMLGVVAVVALAIGGAAQERQTLARVGQANISIDEFRLLMRAMRETGKVDTTLETLTPTGREKLLNALVEKNLYAIGAREEQLDRQPEVRFWLDQAVNEVLAKKYLEAKARAVVVTDVALKEFYDEHPDAFMTPMRVKARHIVLKTQQDAEAVLREAKSGTEFGTLAKERTADIGTRATGGDLGWITRGVMVKPFEDLIFSLEKGEVGGPVQTNLGFHVVKIDDRESPVLPAFDAVKRVVKERKIETELGQLKQQLEARHPVTIDRDVLAGMGR